MAFALKDILHVAILTFGAPVLGLLGNLAHKGVQLVAVKTHNEKLAGILDRVSTLAQSVVKDVYSSYVDPIQKAGKWDDSSASVARTKALTALKSYLGEKGIADLATALGANNLVTSFLTTSVEAAIHDVPAVNIPAPAPSGT